MNQTDQHIGQNLRILAQVITEICQHHTLEEARKARKFVERLVSNLG